MYIPHIKVLEIETVRADGSQPFQRPGPGILGRLWITRIYVSLSLYIYIYIFIHNIYIHIERESEREIDRYVTRLSGESG